MSEMDTFEFKEGDMLYCYYGSLLYEAKCLKRRMSSDGIAEYFIHYIGWKKRWNEWVEQCRVLVVNDINRMHKETLERRQQQIKRTYTSAKERAVRMKLEMNKLLEYSNPKKRSRSPSTKTVKMVKFTPVSESLTPDIEKNKLQVIKMSYVPKVPPTINKIDMTYVNTSIKRFDELIKTNTLVKSTNLFNYEMGCTSSEIEFTEYARKSTESVKIVKNFVVTISTAVTKIKLPKINLPSSIIVEMNDDWLMNNKFKKILQFPDLHNVADIIYDFIELQKSKNVFLGEKAVSYGTILLNLFNAVVNKKLLYQNEIKYKYQNKGFSNFITRSRANESRIYVLKELLHRKKVWCYVYGPVHLIRLFINLSSSSSSLMNDDELAVVSGNQWFLEFVKEHTSKYFSERKYIYTSDTVHTIVNLDSSNEA